MCGAVVQEVAWGKGHDVSVPVASFPFLHIDAWRNRSALVKLQQGGIIDMMLHDDAPLPKTIHSYSYLELLTYVVDEARPVAMLDDLDGSDSAASVQ